MKVAVRMKTVKIRNKKKKEKTTKKKPQQQRITSRIDDLLTNSVAILTAQQPGARCACLDVDNRLRIGDDEALVQDFMWFDIWNPVDKDSDPDPDDNMDVRHQLFIGLNPHYKEIPAELARLVGRFVNAATVEEQLEVATEIGKLSI